MTPLFHLKRSLRFHLKRGLLLRGPRIHMYFLYHEPLAVRTHGVQALELVCEPVDQFLGSIERQSTIRGVSGNSRTRSVLAHLVCVHQVASWEPFQKGSSVRHTSWVKFLLQLVSQIGRLKGQGLAVRTSWRWLVVASSAHTPLATCICAAFVLAESN